MEEFAAQVSWQGVQPSSLGRDEASTAQESQPQPEVVSEVTLESTPQALPVTTPVLKVSDEEDGAVDADYEADMIATQSTWDPWPATTQETSQPAQDAPSLPQDAPAPEQEEPWQDYHLLFFFWYILCSVYVFNFSLYFSLFS